MKRELSILSVFPLFILMMFFAARPAQAQIVYVYPNGGQAGTTFEVLLGGSVGGTQKVLFSGEGIEAKITHRPQNGSFMFQNPYAGKCANVMRTMIQEERRLMPLRDDPERLEEARRVIRLNRQKRREATPTKINEVPTPSDETVFEYAAYFHRLREKPTQETLQLLYYEYDGPNFDRRSSVSYGSVILEVTIAPDAKPGLRELYMLTQSGITRPVWFWVSNVREVNEIEPNEGTKWPQWEQWFKKCIEMEPQEIPFVLNGQIKPGDIDRIPLKLVEGQQLILDMKARSLQPFIANAVPGWFTGLMNLFDPEGKEIKSADSWKFSQDPLMIYRVPKSGTYTLEIRDSIFRGRNDFVYRISIGEFPLVVSHYPLGAPVDSSATINLRGGNLPQKTITPDFKGPVTYDEVREIDMIGDQPLTRPLHYVVETLPIYQEPLDSAQREGKQPPVKVQIPIVAYGVIAKPNEVDVYEFQGKKGDTIVLDTKAQEIDSNLDTVVELKDASGKLIGTNDDRADWKGPNIGTEVHHSDSTLMVKLPADGTYYARIFGSSRRSGPEYYYRLRISPPQPDFIVCMQPCYLRFNGTNSNASFRIFRKEGFKEEVTLSIEGKEDFFIFSGAGKIAANAAPEEDKAFTIRSKQRMKEVLNPLDLVATAKVGDKIIKRRVLPCTDWEQAFIWHHLVPVKILYGIQR
ncbi:MAG: PPC domain-containing protein [Planctomycetia bacterium]|nr:PPC domain-containing protein [Planctomycetia bacterium]